MKLFLSVVGFYRYYSQVTIYGKNKREGDFKLIIEPVKSKPTDKKSQTSLHSSFIIEPPCVWAGNKQKGIFRFIVKLENGKFSL